MASLFNTKISNTYVGLIKTLDSEIITASLKELSDGSGNATGLYINTGGDFKASGILEWGTLKDTGESISITKFVDEADGIASNDDDTSIPTSAAIVDYVASRITLEDLDFSGTTGTGSIDLDSQVFAITGTANQIETTASSQSLTLSFPVAGITLPDGSVATTQSAGDNSTKVATTAYVETAVDTVDTLAEILVIGNTTGATKISVDNTSSGIDLIDDAKIRLGTGNDFEIYHEASTDKSIIKETGASNLEIQAGNLIIKDTSDNTLSAFYAGGKNEFYFNSSKKLETTSDGATVTGGLTATGSSVFTAASFSGTITGDVTGDLTGDVTGNLTGDSTGNVTATSVLADGVTATTQSSSNNSTKVATTAYVDTQAGLSDTLSEVLAIGNTTGATKIEVDNTSSGVDFIDDAKARFGTGNDLEIYHDGSNSYIKDTGTGDLIIESSDLKLRVNGTENGILLDANAGVTLYYDSSARISSTSAGATIIGTLTVDKVALGDNEKIVWGGGSDLQIYHDASHNQILANTAAQDIVFKTTVSSSGDTTALTIASNGDLSTGRDVTIAGDLTVNGTTTTVNTDHFNVEDPLISMAKDNSANSVDIGYYGRYNDGTQRYLGLFSDASDSNTWKLFKGLTVEPTTTVDTAATGYALANLDVAALSITGGTSSGILTFDVGSELRFGAGNEFGMFYSSGVSNIRVNSGVLAIRADDLRLTNQANTEYYMKGISDGAVELYYDNVKKFETTTDGVEITGTIKSSYNGGGAIFTANNGYFTSYTTGGSAVKLLGISNGDAIYIGSIDAGINTVTIRTNGTDAVDIDSSQNTTFAGTVKSTTFLIGNTTAKGIGASLGDINGVELGPGYLTLARDDTADAKQIVFEKNDVEHSFIQTTTDGLEIGGSQMAFSTDSTFLSNYSYTFRDGVGILNPNGTSAATATTVMSIGSMSNGISLITTGSVGIGVTDPENTLQINHAANPTAIRIGDNTTDDCFIIFNTDGNDWSIGTDRSDSNTFKISDYSALGTNDRFSIDTSGDATFSGVQTYHKIQTYYDGDYISGFKFADYNGGIWYDAGNDDLILYGGQANSQVIIKSGGGNTALTLDSGLNATFAGNLIIHDGSNAPYIDFVESGAITDSKARITMDQVDTDNASLLFSTEGAGTLTTRMTINKDGNVGIGNTAPAYPLQVGKSGGTIAMGDATTGNGSSRFKFIGSNSVKNWQISQNDTISGALEIMPSTAGGGSTFTTPAMLITDTGNLGLGTSGVPTVFNTGAKILQIHSPSTSYSELSLTNGDTGATGSDGLLITQAGVNAYINNRETGSINFQTTDNTVRAIIDSSGNLLVHATTKETRGLTFYGGGANGFYISTTDTCGYLKTNEGGGGTDTSGQFITFYNDTQACGSINMANATTINYNTTSDYRLKEDLQDFTGLDKLSKIKMYDFKWKVDGSRSYGAIAHELEEVLPQAVSGEKDGEEMQQADYSKIVPLLVKSIQELKSEVDELKKNCNWQK